jgi:hypothetical protein
MQSGCLFVVRVNNQGNTFFDHVKPLTGFLTPGGTGSTKWNFPSLSWEGVPVLHWEFHTFIGVYVSSSRITLLCWGFIEHFTGFHCASIMLSTHYAMQQPQKLIIQEHPCPQANPTLNCCHIQH